jgi:membrane protein
LKIPSAKKIENFIFKLPLISFLIKWSKDNSLPGFFHVPLFDVISFILVEIKQYNLTMRANSMAFSFFLSLFPSILVIFTLIPFILPYFSGFIIPYIPNNLLEFNPNGSIDFNSTIIAQIKDLINEVMLEIN